MKKTILFFALICYTVIFSQEEKTNISFDLLKNKTETRILYNRVAPIAKLTSSKADAFNTLYYKQAYYEIQRADFLNRLPNLEILDNATEKGFASRVIPISILISEFEALKPSVKEQNQLQLNVDNQYEPISNDIALFNTYKIGLVSPLIKQIKGTDVKFKLDSDLIFNTTNKSIRKIEYSLNDAAFVSVSSNEIISLKGLIFGNNELKFRLTLSNNETYMSRCSIRVEQNAQTLNYNARVSQSNAGTVGPVTEITSSLTYQGYAETSAHAGKGEFQIYYDNEAGLLDKIVVVCDGFDPGDGRDTSAIYNLLNYGTPTQNLGDTVRDLGYDVVVLNFPQYTRPDGVTNIDGGVDYIQRNARVLIELINYLNANKVGNQELVIIGPSMGGLISRYALRYMEMNGMDHKTRLWLSFDSPHLGANVPIGMQHMFNYIAYDSDIADLTVRAIVDSMLKSPAAREMLIDHFEGHLASGSLTDFNTSVVLPTGHPTHRTAFQNELNTMGFPQNCRKIAISNGAGNGSMTGSPGMVVLDALDVPDSEGFTRALLDLNFTPTTNTQLRVSRVRKQAWTFFWLTIGTGQADSKSPTYTAGLDSAPGGQFDIEGLAADAGSNPTLARFLNAMTIKKFDFIPTKSSLAITNTNNWYANVTTSSTTPFDAYSVPTANELHVTLTPTNVAFAIDEIVNNIRLNCSSVTTWDGTTWSNGNPSKDKQVIFAGNYTSNGSIEACSVTVSGNAVVSFQSNHNITVRGKIDVASTAQLNMNNNSNLYQIEEIANAGNVQLKRDAELKRLDYIGWSSPVENQNLKTFSPGTLNNRFYEYVPSGTTTATAYASVDPVANSFSKAKGYLIRAGNAMPATLTSWTGTFKGTPFNGRINQNIVNAGTNLGYNLVGNPYPSPINIEEFIIGNENTIDGTVYFWTNTNAPVGGVYTSNNFASRNLTGGTAATNGSLIPDEYIQVGQGFYVNALATTPMFFTNSMRNNNSNNQFIYRTANSNTTETNDSHKFWLRLSQAGNPHNEILVGYVPNATNELDFGYDGKLMNNGSASLYTIADEQDLVIQGRSLPFSNEEIIPLGFKTEENGMFTISKGNLEGVFAENQPIYIKDKLTNAFINLQEQDFLFIANAGKYNSRFELHFKKQSKEIVSPQSQIMVYKNENNLVVNSTTNKILSLELYDTLGRLLFSKENINSNSFETNAIAKSNSVILVKIVDESQTETKTKVIF